jgi:hypothetical protein
MFERGDYRRVGIEFDDDVWDSVIDELARIVDGIESGWYPQQPERPGFRIYVPCQFCEPDSLGTDDAFERWSRKQHDPRLHRWFGTTDEDGDDAEAADDE